jgi:hypothetical protein
MRIYAIALAVFAASIQPGTRVLAAEQAAIGPLASSQQIRAAHAATGSVLRLIFAQQDSAGPKRLILTLAVDYIHLSGAPERLIDFKLRRAILIDAGAGKFASGSLYADVAFRLFEAENRRLLRGALSAGGVGQQIEMMDPFWAQSSLGMVTPQDMPAKLETATTADGAQIFTYQQTEVARIALSSQPIAQERKTRFLQALRLITALHPSIIEAIGSSGRIPATLRYTIQRANAKDAVTLTLESAATLQMPFPLTADLASDPLVLAADGTTERAVKDLFPIMVEAVNRRAPGPRTVGDYQRAIGEALGRNATFQALLAEFELLLQHGQAATECATADVSPPCHSMREVAALARGEPRAQALLESLSLERQDPDRAIALRRGISRGDIENGFVIDIFLANSLSAKRDRRGADDPMPLFVSAIRGNPYLKGVYKDLGDHLMRAFQMDLAWLCFYLARQLPGPDASGSLSSVSNLEQKLATDFSSFF